MNYFIVGLPRSRTAWLSVFMSQSSKRCIHDGFGGCNNLIEYWDKLEECGDSSTALMLIELNRLKPESPVVIIEKNADELERCIQWCSETYEFDARSHMLEINERLKTVKGLRIKQSEINENLENIWTHLVDDEWRDEYANIKDFNIQLQSNDIDIDAAKKFIGGL